jgi:hypothetical protein
MTKLKSTLTLGIASFAVLGLAVAAAVAPASAADVANGDDSIPAAWDQTVEVGSTSKITISSDTGTPSPAVIPAVAGTAGGFGTVATQLSVSTNDPNGSSLTIQIADLDGTNEGGTLTTLFHDVNTQSVGNVVDSIGSSPTTLTANTWGYNFVSGTTNDIPTIATSFRGVPAHGSAATLLSDNNSTGTQSGYINFGAVVDYTLIAGHTYSNGVVYTAAILK